VKYLSCQKDGDSDKVSYARQEMKQNSRIVFPVIYWTLVILCFFCFPIFLMNLAVNRYFSMIQQEQENLELLKAQRTLAQIRVQSEGTSYFHQLFKRVLARPVVAGALSKELTQRIGRLKKAFPDELEFIVWDQNGMLLEGLTDDKSYVTVKNRFNAYLKELQQITVSSFPQTPLFSNEMKKRVRKFRQLLGPFISSVKIAEAFLPNNPAKCFQMQAKGKRAYGWYWTQSEFSVFVYIPYELVNSMIPSRSICRKSSEAQGSHKFFLIHEKSLQVFPDAAPHIKKELAISLKKTTSLTPPEQLKSGKNFYVFQKLASDWWVVAVIDESRFTDAKAQNRNLMFRLLATVFISFFVLKCYLLVHQNPFSSIRWKLFAIFVYTVAIPLMIFSTVGFEHLAQKEKGGESSRGIELVQLLTKMDCQFSIFLLERAEALSKFTDSFFLATSSHDLTPRNLAHFATQIKQKFSPQSVMMMDEKGNNLFPRSFSDQIADQTLLKATAVDLLDFLNDRESAQIKPITVVTEATILAFSKSNRAIRVFNIAEKTVYYYQQVVPNPATGRYEYIVQMFWDVTELQREFFRNFAKSIATDKQLTPVVFFVEGNYAVPANSFWVDLQDYFKRVDLRGLQLEKYVTGSGKKYLIAGVRGNNLAGTVTAVLLDFDSIMSEVEQHKIALAGLLLTALFFTLALYNLLNYQILNPVNQLIIGVEKVRSGDYAYRVALKTANELGNLGASINETMENLQEMAIAQTVQESLLPESAPTIAGFEIYAKTRSMTKLGGDYFDFFVNQEGRFVAMIADVSGHGVQAALMMAMTKSVLLLAQNDGVASEQIMESLNTTFLNLRKSEINTLLTGQIITFSPSENNCELVNAGHWPPLVISSDGREVTVVNCRSLPLGFEKNRKFHSDAIELAQGSTLILYTDGILESVNSADKVLGLPGFIELIKESFCADLATFYDNLFAGYEKWRVTQDDDITFVLIRRTGDEN